MTVKPYSLRDRVPRRAQDRIEDAGASAYAWYHEQVTAWLDPRGWATRVAAVVAAVALASVATLLTLLAYWQTPSAAVVVAAAVVLGTWRGRTQRTLPWWSSAIAAVVIAEASGAGAVITAWVAGLLAVLYLLTFIHSRDLVLGVFTVVLAGALYGTPGQAAWRPVAALVVAVAVAVTVSWLTAGRRMPLTFGRLTVSQVAATPPAPPTRVPWPLLLWPASRRRLRDIPKEIQKKKAGAYGERRTALILLALRRGRGTRIVHDVAIPGATTANADHVVVARSGVFVLDSKQYGSWEDRGVVRLDDKGVLVHESRNGARSLEQTVATVRWAATTLQEVLGAPTRAVIAVHNAEVVPGLVAVGADGVPVDVIAATALLNRIDGARRVLSRTALSAARFRMLRLRSSATHAMARVTSPLGSKIPVSPWVDIPTDAGPFRGDTRTTEHVEARATHLAELTGADIAPSTVEDDEWADVQPADAASVQSARSIASVAAERVLDGWEQMRVSEPAAPDDTPEELRGLRRGDAVEIVEFRDGSLYSTRMIAMTGACHGPRGPFVWVAHPEHYRLHRETRQPVFVSTVSADKIVYADRSEAGA